MFHCCCFLKDGIILHRLHTRWVLKLMPKSKYVYRQLQAPHCVWMSSIALSHALRNYRHFLQKQELCCFSKRKQQISCVPRCCSMPPRLGPTYVLCVRIREPRGLIPPPLLWRGTLMLQYWSVFPWVVVSCCCDSLPRVWSAWISFLALCPAKQNNDRAPFWSGRWSSV